MGDRFFPYEIIDKKKRGIELSPEEIKYFLNGFLTKEIPDYQMSALLMCCFIRGMSQSETAALTDLMTFSGHVLDFNDESVIDKHSLGGIGDKASFILAPIATAAGVKVPMMAGRSLGFTGGTVDKIESIPGFRTDISLEKFQNHVKQFGLALIGQTEQIAPADKQLYALRDVTATIDSIPLITASIMSKKLAEGAAGIVMDVKVGSGAFMKTKKEARLVAKSLLQTAKRFNRKMTALITDMNQPLGFAVGNTLEIIESIETLKGRGPKDLQKLSVELAGHMIHLAGKASTPAKGITKAKEVLKNGKALEVFRKLIINQDGNEKVIGDYSLMKLASQKIDILSKEAGYVKSFKNEHVGHLLNDLGGGRKMKKNEIDHGVGFYFHKKIGDKVKKDEALLTVYFNKGQESIVESIKNQFINDIIKISKTKTDAPDLIYEILT